MRLVVIGSSSAGNSYAIEGKDESLLIEAGLPLKEVRKMTDLTKVSGTIVSHHHGDHAKHVREFSVRFPIASPKSVLDKCPAAIQKIPIYEGRTVSLGGFGCTPFVVPHSNSDGSPCTNVGWLIHHKELGTALFATDTYTLPYTFPNVNHFIIEANYADDALDGMVASGKLSKSQADRIRLSHFSIDNAIKTITQCGTDKLTDIIFIHLSSRHSDKQMFADMGTRMLGVPVYIAEKGKTIELHHEI